MISISSGSLSLKSLHNDDFIPGEYSQKHLASDARRKGGAWIRSKF
jgi:hypothetical protein